jgi:beta-N-acetylhexosaminidase
MPPSSSTARRRQLVALAVALALTALVWVLLFRGGGGSDEGAAGGGGASDARPQVARVESTLTLPQRVDQVMLIGFHGTDAKGDIADELRKHAMGGVLVGADNWPGAKNGAQLVGGLRAAGLAGNRVAPLIVAQQEGGQYRAFDDMPPISSEFEIASTGKTATVEAWAKDAASALRADGFDLDLFPVADLTGPTSPVRDRGFAASPQATAAFTAAAIRGCVEAKMACAPLHFPGNGSASQDTDEGPASVGSEPQAIQSNDLLPFKAAFRAKAPAVVMSLAFYAAYDPVTPGAFSPSVATGLLRDDLHYKGAAITDDLEAGAIRATESVPQAAVEAIAAGSDMVQVSDPDDVNPVRRALTTAAEDGTIPPQRLADAAARVLELKHKVGLLHGH